RTERLVDALHLARHLAEPYDVWPHSSLGTMRARRLDRQVDLPRSARAASSAERALDLAVHVDEPARAGSLMQRVDVVSDSEHIAMLPSGPGKRKMGGVGLRLFMPAAAEIVELVDSGRITNKCFRRRHVLDLEVLPQTTRTAERAESALGGESRAG